MLLKFVSPLGLAALATSVCASPVVPAVGLADLAVVRAAAPVNSIESRRTLVDARTVNDKRTEASFDLGYSWNGDVLFDGHYTDGQGNPVGLNVVCKTCYTKGTIGASIVDVEELQPSLRLDFSNVEAYVDLAVAVTDAATYTVNLFTSNTPIGFGASGIEAGIIFAVDLVFSLSAEIDISGGGFYVTLPAGAYVESNLVDGQISGSFFQGISAKTLPVTVSSGTATFKCDLRVRTQAGVEGDLVVIGAGLVAGVYINIIELVTIIETSEACGLQCREFLDLNVGAFARADIDIDSKTFGIAPTVSTTLFSLPTATQCIRSIASEVQSIIASATAIAGGSGSVSGSAGGFVSGSAGGFVSATGSVSGSTGPSSATASLNLGGAGGVRLGNSTLSFVGASSGLFAATSTASSSAATTAATTTLGGSNTTITAIATATATDVGLVTATVFTTKTYTITSCKATVVNCPATLQTAITVTQTYTNKYTNSSSTAGKTTATAAASSAAATTAIVDVIVLEPCSTPIINTFFFPSTTTAFTTAGASANASASSAPPTASASYAPPAAGYIVGTGASALTPVASATAAAAYAPPAAGYIVGTGAPAGSTASKNGSLSGSYSPSATVVGNVVTAGAATDKLSGSLAAAAAIFAAAMLL